jgi:hypothetical protein
MLSLYYFRDEGILFCTVHINFKALGIELENNIYKNEGIEIGRKQEKMVFRSVTEEAVWRI